MSVNSTTIMRQNERTGKFEKTTARDVAVEYLRENTRFLRYFVT